MDTKYKSLFLCGFRTMGKATLGHKVAEEMGWEFIKMDDEITKRASQNETELTKSGTYWQRFRQMETDLLNELLERTNIVVSAGSGVGVNHIIKENTSESFGHIQARLLKQHQDVCVVILDAPTYVIADRIKREEMEQSITHPILDETRARHMQTELDKQQLSDADKKESLVNEIVADAIEVLELRRPLYEQISSFQIDTGSSAIEHTVKRIVAILKGQ
ncbi:MAG: shikimate kinase [Candidatus Roizmanbacteria bacterium]